MECRPRAIYEYINTGGLHILQGYSMSQKKDKGMRTSFYGLWLATFYAYPPGWIVLCTHRVSRIAFHNLMSIYRIYRLIRFLLTDILLYGRKQRERKNLLEVEILIPPTAVECFSWPIKERYSTLECLSTVFKDISWRYKRFDYTYRTGEGPPFPCNLTPWRLWWHFYIYIVQKTVWAPEICCA